MALITSTCDNCETEIKTKSRVKYITCPICKHPLTVHHEGGRPRTEIIGQRKTSSRSDNNFQQLLRVENEIARLDREWTIEREKYRMHGRHTSNLPNQTTGVGTIFAMIVGVGFALFWIGKVSEIENPGAFQAFGIVFIIAVVVSAISRLNKSSNYGEAEQQYKETRQKLTQKLNRLNG